MNLYRDSAYLIPSQAYKKDIKVFESGADTSDLEAQEKAINRQIIIYQNDGILTFFRYYEEQVASSYYTNEIQGITLEQETVIFITDREIIVKKDDVILTDYGKYKVTAVNDVQKRGSNSYGFATHYRNKRIMCVKILK